MDVVEVVELDIPYCSLTYGVAPCEAVLGVTGTIKCFNTRKTCQDKENFTAGTLTLRFVRADLDIPYDAIPSLESISITPQVLDPGVSMGQRESVTVTLSDHQHSDVGIDKYIDERDYDAFARGTLWAKLRARITSFKGMALRVRRGEKGSALADLETRHYIVESTAGPDGRSFQLKAKDFLKLLDGDRAQAPNITRGQLATDIAATSGTLTLEPAGIGDEDYPSSGKAVIGGKEVVSYTRVGDVVTLTERGASNTEATAHDAGEAFQDVLIYDSESPADIIYDLLTSYVPGFDSDWIELADWQQEISSNIGRLYSAEIGEPTPVKTLVNELIAQVGLVVWADIEAQRVRLMALRPIPEGAELYDGNRIVEGSFRSKDQPGKRVSQAWTWFNLISPVEPLDERQNYRSVAVQVDLDSEDDHLGEPAIKTTFSRWINGSNRPAAERLNELLIARYSTAPQRFTFTLFRGDTIPSLGAACRLGHESIVDVTGAETTAPAQVISVEPQWDRYLITAEEMEFGEFDGDRNVFIDEDMFNINLRDLYDEIYSAPTSYDTVTFVIASGVKVGSRIFAEASPSPLHPDGALPSVEVGEWPEGPRLRLIVNGRIQGVGGYGGGWNPTINFDDFPYAGRGGTALRTRYPIEVTNNGEIWGGGGGGGGGEGEPGSFTEYGGGGAGYDNTFDGSAAYGGPPAPNYTRGTTEAGGAGNGANAGDGGGPGEPGEDGTGGAGGLAGISVDGDSYVTWLEDGDVRGPKVN